jgi:hypothetical protein
VAKLRLANGKTEMHPGWAVMRESIMAKLEDEAHSSKLTMVVAATQLTELRKEQVRQAEQDAAEMRHALAKAKQNAEQALTSAKPRHEEQEQLFHDPVASARRVAVETSEVAAVERATVLAASVHTMRSAALQRLTSLEQCEAALRESAIHMARKGNDAKEEDDSRGKQEQNQEIPVGLQELHEGSERCLALSAEVRVIRASATLTCGGALHAQSALIDCLEELRRLRLQHTVLERMGQSSIGVVSQKSADDMAQAWMQKSLRPHQEQERKQIGVGENLSRDAQGTGSVSSRSHCTSKLLARWVELLGRCIGAQLSTLVAPALQPDVEDEPKRSAFVLAENCSQAAEARLAQCRDEALRLGCRARAALGTMSSIKLASGMDLGIATPTSMPKDNADATSNGDPLVSRPGSETIATVLVQNATAELQMYCERRDAAESQATCSARTALLEYSGEGKKHEQNLQVLKTVEFSLLHQLQQ